MMDFLLLFDSDNKFHIFETTEKFFSSYPLLKGNPGINAFLSSPPTNDNSRDPTLTLITILNDVLRDLAKDIREISTGALDTFGNIFGMIWRKFEDFIIFRPKVRDCELGGFERLINMFGDLITIKKANDFASIFAILVGVFVFAYIFHSFEKVYTQCPLTDDQRNKIVKRLDRLQDILEAICKSLNEGRMNDFHDEIKKLKDFIENDFRPFLEEFNNSLKSLIRNLEKEKTKEVTYRNIAAGVFIFSSVGFVGMMFVQASVWLKGATGFLVSGSGGYVFSKHYVIKNLRKVVEDHKNVEKITNDSIILLKSIQKYATKIKSNEEDVIMLDQQFTSYKEQVKKLRERFMNIEYKNVKRNK